MSVVSFRAVSGRLGGGRVIRGAVRCSPGLFVRNGDLSIQRLGFTRSMAVFLKQEKAPVWYKEYYRKAKTWLGVEKPKIVAKEGVFKKGSGLNPDLCWRTKYPTTLLQYKKSLKTRSQVRRIRMKNHRKLRKRLKAYMKILKQEKKRKEAGTTARGAMDVDPELVATELPSMYREKDERKWKPAGYYSFPKVPGTQQPLAPDDFDPTAPPIMKRKPITNGVRHVALISRAGLYKGRPLKQLTAPLKKKAGRCSITGKIIQRGRGGGYRRQYRIIDFRRANHMDMEGTIERIEYDPNRTSFICLLKHEIPEGKYMPLANLEQPYSYIICPLGVRVGYKVMSSKSKIDPEPGNAMPLKFIPQGTTVHNIQFNPDSTQGLVRAAGGGATIMNHYPDRGLVLLKLPSKEQRYFSVDCMATVGEVSNTKHYRENLGKAGRSRNRGRRPMVRGVAMNPVDHPHGGGNGKTSGGRPSVSIWGWLTKSGRKTRNKRKPSSQLIVMTKRQARELMK
ncbi:hypothetical protein NDN08_006916 [Rhodosorus marinus]|uniref:50S ribosomal protein L2, chloroplastic n=1 Tax=Rhodosorus marinus TaxID=101924 RepID=A0AAV8UN54_9RHOD|nr:hypothetical protein NDN08_006916 [Rhodosorus marinus]